MESITKLYLQTTGKHPADCRKIAGGGSNRQYYRLTDTEGHSLIGVEGTSLEENSAFIYLTRHFAGKGLNVPEIIAVSKDGLSYLQTDLGTVSLYDALKEGRENAMGYSETDIALLERTIGMLPELQIHGAEGMDFSRCYPQQELDAQNVMFDLNYFKYCFLKTTGLDFNEVKLEECFDSMAEKLTGYQGKSFMYRDFQARNIMLSSEGEPYFIDYQGGRRGPLQYDLVSFLWQASSHFSQDIRNRLIDVYVSSLKKLTDIDEKEFRESIPQWVLFRTLQVLGAYGFRGRYERKKYFLDSIPAAMQNLRDVLALPGSCPYPYLYKVLQEMADLPEFNQPAPKPAPAMAPARGELKVRVFSFSYKKGIPGDESGNGGGYVFDCRSTHNPGRYEQYKSLTGLDKSVIDFLEKDGEITEFLQSVYKLADAHVQRYMQRGFTSLMFSFGCTGGQHRSVYSAQHLAEYINSRYGIEVSLEHREQDIRQNFPARKKAMIFAAGLGTRLKPITETTPKALVEIAGKPLIEHVMRNLVASGFNDIVINVHHFADKIENWAKDGDIADFIRKNNVRIAFSDERKELLETGGGIAHAASMLRSGNPRNKFLVHNVDILSNVNLNAFNDHCQGDYDAMLLVSSRKTARYLVFNSEMRLVGWINIQTREIRTPFEDIRQELENMPQGTLDTDNLHLRAFAGIHLIDTKLLDMMTGWPEKFSIIDFYLSICHSTNIKAYTQTGLNIVDVGKLDTLALAEEFIKKTH